MNKVLAGAQVKVRAARVQPRAPPTLRFSYRTNIYLLFMVISSRTALFCLMMTESFHNLTTFTSVMFVQVNTRHAMV